MGLASSSQCSVWSYVCHDLHACLYRCRCIYAMAHRWGQATTWCSLPCLKMGLLCLSTNYVRRSNLKICEDFPVSASNLPTTVLSGTADAHRYLWLSVRPKARPCLSELYPPSYLAKLSWSSSQEYMRSCSWIPLQLLALKRFLFYVAHGKTLFPVYSTTLTPITECVGWGK